MSDKACSRCRSWAINPHTHGRDDTDPDLCDVCYWRKRAEQKSDPTLVACLRHDKIAVIVLRFARRVWVGPFDDGVNDPEINHIAACLTVYSVRPETLADLVDHADDNVVRGLIAASRRFVDKLKAERVE